jgi:hypothetical protein
VSWYQMKSFIGRTIRLALFATVVGWLGWLLIRDQAMRACFPGQDAIAPFPGDPGSRCQELLGQVPYVVIVVAVVVAAVIVAGGQALSNRPGPRA